MQSQLAIAKIIDSQAYSLVKTTDNLATSLDNFTNELTILQSNTKTMANVTSDDDLSTLKLHFEKASVFWGDTQDVASAYQQLEVNTSDDPIEINPDDIDTEEDLEEVLKEAYGDNELIDTSELTDEELEELLCELLENVA